MKKNNDEKLSSRVIFVLGNDDEKFKAVKKS